MCRAQGREGPRPIELIRGDRKIGGGHDPGEHGEGVAFDRHVHVDAGIGPVTGREEGQPLGVIPVQVAEEHRTGEGPAVEQGRHATQAGPRVEEQGGRRPVVGQRHTRRVAAVAYEVGTGRRRGTPHAAHHDTHGATLPSHDAMILEHTNGHWKGEGSGLRAGR